MWATIWPMPQPASPAAAGGRHATAAGGSAATSRSVRRLTLSKNRRYAAMSVIMASSSSLRSAADGRDGAEHPAGQRRHAGVLVLLAHELDADRQPADRQQGHGDCRRE